MVPALASQPTPFGLCPQRSVSGIMPPAEGRQLNSGVMLLGGAAALVQYWRHAHVLTVKRQNSAGGCPAMAASTGAHTISNLLQQWEQESAQSAPMLSAVAVQPAAGLVRQSASKSSRVLLPPQPPQQQRPPPPSAPRRRNIWKGPRTHQSCSSGSRRLPAAGGVLRRRLAAHGGECPVRSRPVRSHNLFRYYRLQLTSSFKK